MFDEVTRLIYVTSNLLTRQSADTVYILEMHNAFSKIVDTTLVVPRTGITREKIKEIYGIHDVSKIVEITLPGIFYKGVIPGRSIFFSLLAAKALREDKNALIITREPWLLFILSVLIKKLCYFDAHQFRFDGRLQEYIYRIMVKISAGIGKTRMICISHMLKKQWEKLGIDGRRIFVLHDAVNIEKYKKPLTRHEARMEMGLHPGRKYVVYTGSLGPGKGVDILLKAANRLPEVSFVIVGGNEEQIYKLTGGATLENVIFICQVPPVLIPVYQASADVLALPNTWGGVIDDVTSPMKLFEYMAAGRPIAATDMPTLLEVLDDGYNALISPAGDDGKLAANIRLLLDNIPTADELTRNASKDLEKYSWDYRVRKILEIYYGKR